MALLLAQHGRAFPKERDPDRSLTNQGIDEVKNIAEIARSKGVVGIAEVLHSGKKRAEQTAMIFDSILKSESGTKKVAGLAPDDDPIAFSQSVDLSKNMMIVGHLPFLEKFVSYLLLGTTNPPVLKFQNAGIVCLAREEQGVWAVQWTLTPEYPV